MKLTNKHNIPTAVAVWLAFDTYDHIPDPTYFSATDLIRPIKASVLSKRPVVMMGKEVETSEDISSVIASRIGTAIHDGIENAWHNNYKNALTSLGFPEKVINNIVINPPRDTPLPDNAIPVYMEQRMIKEFRGFKIGGKFDLVLEGQLEDYKSTKVYSYMKGESEEYEQQASIYRWLNQDIVKKETFKINYILTDWLRSKTLQDPTYPDCAVKARQFNLMSIEETEAWIASRLNTISNYLDKDEGEMPLCTDEELWRTPAVFKYYKNPTKLTKSTKNFPSLAEATVRLHDDGNVGIIQEHKGKVNRCNYCPAFQQCQQKDQYISDGTLVPNVDVIA